MPPPLRVQAYSSARLGLPDASAGSVVPPTLSTLGDRDGYCVEKPPLSPAEAMKETPWCPMGVANMLSR